MRNLLKAIGQKLANKLEWMVFRQRSLERSITLGDGDLVSLTEHGLYVNRKGRVYRVNPDLEDTSSENPEVRLKYIGETRILSLGQFQTYGTLRESH
jgi:hypothetical protein